MYEAFYELTERPFNFTPDPRFLYLSEKHKDAFAHLVYGIERRGGFVMVTGEIGTGKTTICRALLNQLDTDTEVAYIFNPSMSPQELLRKINQDFGIESRGQTVRELNDELNDFLIDRNARGKNCVVMIDEAQNLTPEVLEQVRLLSNLETETQKLLQIVLIGQPELAQHLQLPQLRQLNQRIAVKFHLYPLSAEETAEYIDHRLRIAGANSAEIFSVRAKRETHAYAGGVPRLINLVCDHALLQAYVSDQHEVTDETVRTVIREMEGYYMDPEREARQPVVDPLR